VSAVPDEFLARRPARKGQAADRPGQEFWQWFALGVLLFCWIAEATMCAERGF
jgi:hypothetical protein